jgi:hypothetical protein
MKLRAAWAVGLVLAVAVAFPRQDARADLVTDWNKTALEVMKAAKAGGNPASRALAMVHVAVSDAVNTVQGRYTRYAATMPAASSAARTILVQLYPAQKAMIEEAFDAGRAQGFGRGAASVKAIPDGAAKTEGVALGEKVAAAVQADRASDGTDVPDTYRPITTPGV